MNTDTHFKRGQKVYIACEDLYLLTGFVSYVSESTEELPSFVYYVFSESTFDSSVMERLTAKGAALNNVYADRNVALAAHLKALRKALRDYTAMSKADRH